MERRPPKSTLFPFTTLFPISADAHPEVYAAVGHHPNNATGFVEAQVDELRELARHPRCVAIGERSEEHTSELQSRQYLVCRLLLEKKTSSVSGALGSTCTWGG